jgi:hypothetical protein
VKVGNDRENRKRKKELQACKVFNRMDWQGNFAQRTTLKNDFKQIEIWYFFIELI